MARDAELDRLKAAQDSAFQRKQEAHRKQQAAWDRRSSAREVMNRAHEAKQRAYQEQDRTWQYYQNVRNANGPRIDSLNGQQEQAFQNMKRSFENASAAHDRRDGASASNYASDGHRYKAEAQGYVAERRRLVDEIRSARASHEASKPAFQRVKDEFSSAKRVFDSAKVEHEHAQNEFKRAKEAFDSASKAFRSRLERVKAEGKRKREDKKAIAERAGVAYQYRENVRISTDSAGNTNIYFGGLGKPNGPGHGHYVMDRSGAVTYRRDPFDPHGAQNFQEASAASLYVRSARRNHDPMGTNEHGGVFYRRGDDGGTILHVTQYFADNYHVSWDATPYGNSNVHWTNKNVHKGHPDRFVAPTRRTLHLEKGANPSIVVIEEFSLYNKSMKTEQQAILARDMIQMIRESADDANTLEYLESFAFSLARGLEDTAVVSWDDIAGVCDQRYYSLKNNNPVPLNTVLLDRCEQSIQSYLPM
jgi:hypothetical protein